MQPPEAAISPLVYSLCQQRKIPVLVTDRIARYLDEQDLLTISTISQALNEQAKPLIYKDIILDFSDHGHCAKRAPLLLRTLLTSGTAASYLRNLALVGNPLREWKHEEIERASRSGVQRLGTCLRGRTPPEILFDLSNFTLKEIDLYHRENGSAQVTTISDFKIPLSKLCTDIIGLIPQLQCLKISFDFFRYPDFCANLKRMQDSDRFLSLQRCCLCLDLIYGKPSNWPYTGIVEDWDNTLSFPFSAPKIESVHTVMTLHPETIEVVRPTTLTSLELNHCQIDGFDLNGLLAATPRLRYLRYHASVDVDLYKSNWSRSGMKRSLGLDALFDALQHVRKTLRELITSQDFDSASINFDGDISGYEPPYRQHHELSQLEHLETLTIPYASLLGWYPQAHGNFEWDKILPASLQQLTFTDDLRNYFLAKGWTAQYLVPVLTDFVVWSARCNQGPQSLKFTLRRLCDNEDQFDEPAQQELSRICESYGISCTIEEQPEAGIYN